MARLEPSRSVGGAPLRRWQAAPRLLVSASTAGHSAGSSSIGAQARRRRPAAPHVAHPGTSHAAAAAAAAAAAPPLGVLPTAAAPASCSPAGPPQLLPLHERIRDASSCAEVAALVRRAQRVPVPTLTAAVCRAVALHKACLQQQAQQQQAQQQQQQQPQQPFPSRRRQAAQRQEQQQEQQEHRQQQQQALAANRAALGELLTLAHARLEQLDAWALSQCLRAAAAMQQPPPAEQQAAWQRRLEQLLPSARPQSLATSVWAAAKLGWRLDGTLAAAADAGVLQAARAMNAQDAATVLWAAATSSWQPSSAAAAALQRRLCRLLPEAANSQDVANSLWAASRLGWRLDAAAAAAAAAAVRRAAPSMPPQALASTLVAFASSGWPLGDAAAAALQRRLPAALPAACPQAVANSLRAASQLGWQMDGPLSDAAGAALLRTLPLASAEGVTDALWAYGHGGWQLGGGIQAALAAELPRALQHATPRQLADACKAFGRLGFDPGAAVLAAATAAVEQLLLAGQGAAASAQQAGGAAGDQTATPQALRNLLWSLSELGVSAPGGLAESAAAWLGRSLGQLSPLEACDVLGALARCRGAGAPPPTALLDAAAQRCLDSLAAGDAAGPWLGSLVWACSASGHALPAAALERLVPAAAAAMCPAWLEGDRAAAGAAMLLVEGLARQPGCAGAASPAVAAALAPLLPLVAADVQCAAEGRPLPQTANEVAWLASWAGSLASLGLALPAGSRSQLLAVMRQRRRQLRPIDRAQLARAFAAWGDAEGLSLLELLDAAGACAAAGTAPPR